jgi:hypothetical protein
MSGDMMFVFEHLLTDGAAMRLFDVNTIKMLSVLLVVSVGLITDLAAHTTTADFDWGCKADYLRMAAALKPCASLV